jgi:hypothetical protein
MRIPDPLLDAIFFLGVDNDGSGADSVKYGGSGFVLSAPNEFYPSLRQLYLVTARHNIDSARRAGRIWIRINTATASILFEPDPSIPWVFHEDPAVDLAIATAVVPEEAAGAVGTSPIGTERILSSHDVQVFNFGPGSDLVTIGLFSNREGEARNIPVIRTGIVSAMPGEPIGDSTGNGPYVAYLAEILSIGGLSGSPVFYHPTSGTAFPTVSFYLVGLIRSHWDELPPDAPPDLPRREWMNRGIAAITPATRILEMLEMPAMREERRREPDGLSQRGPSNGKPVSADDD